MGRKNPAIKIAVIIFLAGGIIFFRASPPVRWFREKSIGLMRPLMGSTTRAGRYIGGSADGEQLTKENERLRAENFDREKLIAHNQALEAALGFREAAHVSLTGARVLLYTADLGREALLIDQGAGSAIKKGDVVVDEYGALVGEVNDVGDDSSRVLIASNPGITFPVVLSPSFVGALARGMGARTFSLELIPHTTAIRPGDFVGRTMPGFAGGNRSIVAATVSGEVASASGAFASAHAILLARPEALEYVFVIPISKASP